VNAEYTGGIICYIYHTDKRVSHALETANRNSSYLVAVKSVPEFPSLKKSFNL